MLSFTTTHGLRPYRNYKVLKPFGDYVGPIASLRPYRNYEVLKQMSLMQGGERV